MTPARFAEQWDEYLDGVNGDQIPQTPQRNTPIGPASSVDTRADTACLSMGSWEQVGSSKVRGRDNDAGFERRKSAFVKLSAAKKYFERRKNAL